MDEENIIPVVVRKAEIVEENEAGNDDIEPSEREKALVAWVLDHVERWRNYRDQNYLKEWERYERIFRGQWSQEDKQRQSERSKIISPATQQAVETRHAEIMEAIFGQGEFFDIEDDIADKSGKVDVEKLKAQLNEDFGKAKIRKAIDQIVLMGEIYGTGLGEIVVTSEKDYAPAQQPVNEYQVAYGVQETERICVKLVPVNPKNFLFDPNGTSVDDCMGVAIERYTSIHKVAENIASGIYKDVDIKAFYKNENNEPTQEKATFQDDRVLQLTYYGLVPKSYLDSGELEDMDDADDYSDMVEAIVVIGNDSVLLKGEATPYMMKDRPVLAYQADTVPLRLLGRGTVEKADNMQRAIDSQMRSHLDALALTVAPMIGLDATRIPRGAKFEVQPGKSFLTNGNPNEILFPFKFGSSGGEAMATSKEFERMLLMATGTVDSQGMITQGSRDAGGLAPAVATIIKKYKRTLVNFQEDFLIPFIYKAAYRYMQFAPEKYPSTDVKFCPTGSLGIIAREYEQQQLAFLMQTLGGNSPMTPILMQGIISNSSLPNREKMLEQIQQVSKPNPQAQQAEQMQMQAQAQDAQATSALKQAQAQKAQAEAQKAIVEAQLAPQLAQAKLAQALSTNLDDDNEGKDFERRAKIAELMLKEKDIDSNERIATKQMVFSNG